MTEHESDLAVRALDFLESGPYGIEEPQPMLEEQF